ncbi:MAG: HvfC/BufC N-terminal domain-containing protein [Limisphaerales bacterium]
MPSKRQKLGELQALQRLMAHTVMRPLTPAAKMNPRWIDGTPTRNVVASFIKPNDRLTSLERLQLYNRQYWFRLLDCFYEDYPGLCAVLGERKFSRLAQEYFTECPSASFTMRNLGQCLVRFIESHPKLVAPENQLALDMARLEWAHIEAFDNAAETPITADEMRDANPKTLHLRLQPYLTLLRLNYELDDFLIAVRRGQGLRHEASNARENHRKHLPNQLKSFQRSETVYLAVHRHRNSVFYKRLRSDQFAVLSALRQGVPLEKALTKAAESGSATRFQPKQITKWFQDWSALGWFCREAEAKSKRKPRCLSKANPLQHQNHKHPL